MAQSLDEQPYKVRGSVFFTSALLVLLLAFIAACQWGRAVVTVGHDTWEFMPIQDWSVTVGNSAGFWDGIDLKTHQDIGGRIYWYGPVECSTNTR